MFEIHKTFIVLKIVSILFLSNAAPKTAIPCAWNYASEQIQVQIDQSVDPCNDFFQFACGGIIKTGQSMNDRLQNFTQDALNEAIGMLSKPQIVSIPGGEFYNDLKNQLTHCDQIRSNINQQNEYSALINLIDSIGGYPTVETTSIPLPPGGIDGRLRRQYAQNTFLQADISADIGRFTFRGLPATPWPLQLTEQVADTYFALFQMVAQEIAKLKSTTLSIEQFEVDKEDMSEMLKDLLQASGILSSDAWAKYASNQEWISSILPRQNDFIRKWIELEGTTDQVRFGTWKSNLIANSTFGFNWDQYFSQLQLPFSDDEIIYVPYPNYFNQLATILGKYNDRVLQNYRVFLLVSTYQFPLLLANNSQATCDPTALVPYGILSGLYALSVQDAPKYKNSIGKLLGYVKNATDERVSNLPWMDTTSKRNWAAKSAAIGKGVAYSDGFEPSAIAHTILNLGKFPTDDMTTASTYIGFISSWNRWQFPADLALFAKLNINGAVVPFINTLEINAYYSNMNSDAGFILLPLALMHQAIPDLDYPPAYQFGAYGAVLGHELGHAVYSFPNSYITSASKSQMQSKASCIVEQYDEDCMTNPNNSTDIKCDNGNQTETEDVPDFLGIRTGFSAYKKFVTDNPQPDDRLPGLPKYTMDQIYFIAAAWLYCGKEDWSQFTTQILMDQHSPGNFRVLGQTRGNPEFAKSFGCACGTKMNPNAPYCDIWDSNEEIQNITCMIGRASDAKMTGFKFSFVIAALLVLFCTE